MPTATNLSPIRLVCLLALAIGLCASPLAWGKKHKVAAVAPADSDYLASLSAANRFLAAWQSNDQAAALTLMTNRAKQQATEEGLDKFFSGSSARAFEITRRRALRQGRCQFSVALLQADGWGRTRRRFADLVVVNTGKNDWAVDKLP